MQLNVPASVKLFVFADKLVPADTPFSAGTMISFSQKKVKTNELAVYLLAFTLWDLFQSNSINLEMRDGKNMFFLPTKKLSVSLKKDIPVLGDLENWLVRGINSNDNVMKLIHTLLKEDDVWPHRKIIHIVSADACDMGIGKTGQSNYGKNPALLSFSGDFDFEVERTLVSQIEAEFDLKVQQWNQFLVTAPKIAGLMITACRAALNSRVIQND